MPLGRVVQLRVHESQAQDNAVWIDLQRSAVTLRVPWAIASDRLDGMSGQRALRFAW